LQFQLVYKALENKKTTPNATKEQKFEVDPADPDCLKSIRNCDLASASCPCLLP